MHIGNRILCPHCGEPIIVKTRAVRTDDWKSTGQEYFCMFCSRSLGPVRTNGTEDAGNHCAADKLAALLETAPPTPAIRLDGGGESRAHFCRDCAEFIAHPFLSGCQGLGRDADPWGVCPYFTPNAAVAAAAETATQETQP